MLCVHIYTIIYIQFVPIATNIGPNNTGTFSIALQFPYHIKYRESLKFSTHVMRMKVNYRIQHNTQQ